MIIDSYCPVPGPTFESTGRSEIQKTGRGSLEEEFRILAAQWRNETRILSSIQSKVFNSKYQRIMGMGKAALPLIFNDLLNNGGQWYWALECITGDNPAVNAANIQEAKKAWLQYADRHGYFDAYERRN